MNMAASLVLMPHGIMASLLSSRWSQAHGNIKKISPETMQRIGNGYLFLDWFAIPQLPGRDQWRMGIFKVFWGSTNHA
jgi:uncharacterized protein YjeT (DUF2065 family)